MLLQVEKHSVVGGIYLNAQTTGEVFAYGIDVILVRAVSIRTV